MIKWIDQEDGEGGKIAALNFFREGMALSWLLILCHQLSVWIFILSINLLSVAILASIIMSTFLDNKENVSKHINFSYK